LVERPDEAGGLRRSAVRNGPFRIETAGFVRAGDDRRSLGGSGLVIFGKRWAWLGAGALAVFTLATIPMAHDFWNMDGQIGFLEKTLVQEHMSIIGGLILAAILGELRKD
jgi:hypothetical protein